MKVYNGKTVFQGISVGKILFYEKKEQAVVCRKTEDVCGEILRYRAANQEAIRQLEELYEKAVDEVGADDAAVFDVHAMMLQDEDYVESIENMITSEQVNAEYAVFIIGKNFSAMFENMENEYFRARAADVKDISERVVCILDGSLRKQGIGEEPVIVAACDLSPSETVQMDKEKLLGFVTQQGSSNSHTAILARNRNIPAIIGVEISSSWNGHMAVLDGHKGQIIIDPDEETLNYYRKCQEEERKRKALLQTLKGKTDETKSGKHIRLYANVGSIEDIENALENDAAGIGLFRSEFIYLEADNYPDEETQFQIYKAAAEKMGGKQVIIRTLDIGADKQAYYFNLAHEENPAMGYRGIRLCLERLDVFKTQLRAILRASAFGNIAIMYPMIISVEEVRKAKIIVDMVREELRQQGIAYGELEQGVMIETPAAVMISEELSKEVDFFSIGTNDLTQYTLAIERQNMKLDDIYDAHHPAILKMIQMTIENGHKNGCWVGICGELGADLTLTEKFIEMGIDEISVSSSFILPIRQRIREI